MSWTQRFEKLFLAHMRANFKNLSVDKSEDKIS